MLYVVNPSALNGPCDGIQIVSYHPMLKYLRVGIGKQLTLDIACDKYR
jgi:hypothetical protein